MTDNKNRTVAEVRHIFSKHGGNLGENGCVAWLFEKKGTFTFNKDDVSEDRLMEIVLDAGAQDLRELENEFEVLTDPLEFEAVREVLDSEKMKYAAAEITMVPKTTVDLDEQKAIQMMKFLEKMEDNDDVQHVYANFNISDEIMERLS